VGADEFIGQVLEPVRSAGDEYEIRARRANWRANSAPSPELAPVTMTVWRR
jgi:hypothetical protein